MSKTSDARPVAIQNVTLRALGNSFGFTAPKDGLDDLDLLDDDGDLIDDEIEARAIMFDDGTVRYELDDRD